MGPVGPLDEAGQEPGEHELGAGAHEAAERAGQEPEPEAQDADGRPR